MTEPKFTWYAGMKVTPDFASQEQIDRLDLGLTLGKNYTVIPENGWGHPDACIYVIKDDGVKYGFYWYRFRPASLDDMVVL